MQEQKARRARSAARRIARVQLGDGLARRREHGDIGVDVRDVGIDEVTQQRELRVRLGVGQVMQFELPGQGRHRLCTVDQRRDHDEAAMHLGHARSEGQARQDGGAQRLADEAVDHGDHRLAHWPEHEQRRDGQPRRPDIGRHVTTQQPRHQADRQQRHSQQVGRGGGLAHRRCPSARPSLRFEAQQCVQCVFTIAAPPVGAGRARIVDVSSLRGQRHQYFGHGKLATPATPSQALHLVQRGVLRGLALGRVHGQTVEKAHCGAAARDDGAPVNALKFAQRGDGVANALLILGCLVVLPGQRSAHIGELHLQPGVEQARRRSAEIFTPLHQGQQEGLAHTTCGELPRAFAHCEMLRVGASVIEPVVRRISRSLLRCGAFGQAAQVLDQHHAQGRVQRPQLGQRQRLYLLVGAQIGFEQACIEATVGVRDPRPGHAVDARQASQWFISQERQQLEETARQASTHSEQLLVEQGCVVEQPVRCWPEVATLARAAFEEFARALQHGDVLRQAWKEHAAATAWHHCVRACQAAAVLFEPRRAEQSGTYGRLKCFALRVQQAEVVCAAPSLRGCCQLAATVRPRHWR